MASSKKIFMAGMGCGAIIATILTVTYFRRPSLNSEAAKGAYAVGVQMGKNLTRQYIDFDSRVIAAALQDVKTESFRLSEEQIHQGNEFIHRSSVEKRRAIEPRPDSVPPVIPPGGKDGDGFTVSQLGFRFKAMNTEPGADTNELEERFAASKKNHEKKVDYSFHLIVRDQQGREYFNSVQIKKEISISSFKARPAMRVILGALKKGESIQVKTHPHEFWGLNINLPPMPSDEAIYEIQKIN